MEALSETHARFMLLTSFRISILLLVLMWYPAHIMLTNNRKSIQRKQIVSSIETLNSFPEQLFFLGARGSSEFQSFFAVVLAALLTLRRDWSCFLR